MKRTVDMMEVDDEEEEGRWIKFMKEKPAEHRKLAIRALKKAHVDQLNDPSWGLMKKDNKAALLVGLMSRLQPPLPSLPTVSDCLVALEIFDSLPTPSSEEEMDVREMQSVRHEAMPDLIQYETKNARPTKLLLQEVQHVEKTKDFAPFLVLVQSIWKNKKCAGGCQEP